MWSGDRRWVLSYNGEVYNMAELRAELEAVGVRLRGHSDSELIVEGCARWGVDACVDRLNGMFAFAIWDRRQRRLSLVRDRVGVKPLHWARLGKLFLFGSELKALLACPGWEPEVDRNVVAEFMRHGYIAAPRSIYRGVNKLEPGQILTLDENGAVRARCYWDIRTVARNARRSKTQDECDFETLLKDSVRRCMIADVPLGAFLSGGVDSSAVVALMQSQSARRVRTFTIGFDDRRYNEAEHAKAVAAHLGTEHTELYVNESHLLETIPALSASFDEPFADPSQIPTHLLAVMTRQHVKVALSGDGGDELFGGYTRYFQAKHFWNLLCFVPPTAKRLLGQVIEHASASGWQADSNRLPEWLRSPHMLDRLHKLAAFMQMGDSTSFYRQVSSHWPRPDDLILDAQEPRGHFWDESIARDVRHLIDRMRLTDFLTYLPDHCLTKLDRVTMSTGLEGRVPLLDHRIVSHAWSISPRSLGGEKDSKLPLRRVLYKYVPGRLINRQKWGFVPPIGGWLRGPLRDWAEDLISERTLREQALLNPEPVRARWRHHLARRPRGADWCSPLWNVLVFQAWLAEQKSRVLAAPLQHGAPRRECRVG
jgi:asparagine synthase (glutamine-hydrolysing)